MSLQAGQTSEPPLTMEEEMRFWLDKAVAWDQSRSPESHTDTCLHLSKLRAFLQQLLALIDQAVSNLQMDASLQQTS